jgi:hypothetical protein
MAYKENILGHRSSKTTEVYTKTFVYAIIILMPHLIRGNEFLS